jgi:diacylglycerol kinase
MPQKSRLYSQNTNSNYQPFKSAKYAIEGLIYAFKTEPNLWIQFSIGVFFFTVNLLLGHWILAIANLIFMAMVGSFELINTIVENICDLIDPSYNPKIKIIKDMAAGAVLFVSLVWLLIIFIGCVSILIDIANAFHLIAYLAYLKGIL